MNFEPNKPNAQQHVAGPLHRVRNATDTTDLYADARRGRPSAVSQSTPANLTASSQAQIHWRKFLWLLAPILIVEGLTTWCFAAPVSVVPETVVEVRELYPSEWSVPYPTGLAYISDHDHLALLTNMNASGPFSDTSLIVTITPYEDLVSTITLTFAVDNAINLTYDATKGNLLVLDPAASQIVQVPIGNDGIADGEALVRVDIGHLGLGQPAGMAVDTTARRLFILDNSATTVVIADLDNEFALVSKLDLTHLPATDLQGLSIHPGTHTLFVASPAEALLFEVTVSGNHINTYDLAPLGSMDVQGLTFGPSADLTDAPDTIHFFLADRGGSGSPPSFGRIVEGMLPPKESIGDQTLQESTGDQTLRFAVIGDFGRDNENQARVAALVHGWNPDFIITTGDNNYPDGEASTIDQNIGKYFSPYIGNYSGAYGPGSPTNRFWPTLGNHDWHTMICIVGSCSGAYLDYFTLPNNERYYAVDFGLVRLFALDSESDEPDGRRHDSVQAAWLSKQLAASTADYNVVFFHRAPYGSGRHGSHSVMQWPFAEWGADVVLSGHDHLYERLEVDGIPYFVNGAGGATLYDFENLNDLPAEAASLVRFNEDHGAMLVTASTTGITYQFYTADGLLIDNYTVVKECADVPAGATMKATRTPVAAITPSAAPIAVNAEDCNANGSYTLHLPLMGR